jgi:nitroreductase
MNNFLDVINTRTSVREFTGEKIPEEDINKILKAGTSAPTAVNTQPWGFLVVTERKNLDELCKRLPYAKMLDKAACAIIVCGIPGKEPSITDKLWITDCSAASQNILLAVHALGYGAVWTALYPHDDLMDIARDLFSIPKDVIPLNVIPIGVPLDKNQIPKDKFTKDVIHREKW